MINQSLYFEKINLCLQIEFLKGLFIVIFFFRMSVPAHLSEVDCSQSKE